jgi:hypothetical protein
MAFLVLLVLLPAGARAQVERAELNRALNALEISVRVLPAFTRTPRLVAVVQWLRERGRSTDPSQVTPEYVRSLQHAADLLRRQPAAVVVDDVTEELETKAEHCRALGLGMGGVVLLQVNTRRGAQTLSDWQVLYLLKIYERASDASATAFPQLSTPTEARLEPGRYWLWARDPSTGRTSDRVLVRVAGRLELPVDLPVP